MSHFEKMGAKKDYLERRGPIQVSNPEAATWSAEFDGKGGVVAHSMYPPFGVLHLDGDEEWHTRNNGEKDSKLIDLRLVLVHEIGHTLGLRHSRRKMSVMKKHYE
ncbi:hypothetical protein CAEBREN_24575 [Caenorhabditis brenneri]|uniref:Peptidase M10 metallopeptidase domain-containing protein n=1 Tax=Caenorhabditis brenneri TaxID=135651 RepID=G0MYN9_CAEBE|nr:hypothetical protein CAEBREN_24575 [Caenorhabditis brenneri]